MSNDTIWNASPLDTCHDADGLRSSLIHFCSWLPATPIPTSSLANAKFSLYLVDKVRKCGLGESPVRSSN
jgi:hypothetical protein